MAFYSKSGKYPSYPVLCVVTRKLVNLCGDFLYGVYFNPAILNRVEKKGIETIFPFYPRMSRLQWMSPKF
jgi:hypothetical protein